MTLPDPTPTTGVGPLEPDWLLDLLTSMADAGSFTVAITLWTPAGIISGDLVGGPAWVRELRRTLRSGGDEQAQHFADDLQSVEEHIVQTTAEASRESSPREQIHLRNAATLLPTGEVFRHGLWRGRLVDVAGWTLGKP